MSFDTKKTNGKKVKAETEQGPPLSRSKRTGKEQEVTDVVYQCSRVHKGSVGCCLTPKKNG